jgi:hypothetical protein
LEGFSLKRNPFALLRVSPRAKIAEIEDAFEDAVIDRPSDEQVLLKIKQLLLTPNARLIAELSWLSEIAPRRADQLVAMLDRTDAGSLLCVMPDLPPLTAANLAAEGAARLSDTRFIPVLITSHAQVDSAATLHALNSTRATAGFARVDASQISDALCTLRTAHARSALVAIVAQKDPPRALADLLTDGSDPHEPMLKEIFREYDQWSSPHLGEIERDIDAALASLMGGDDGAVDRVNALLASWDELSQPAQLYCQLSGLDEERSLRIYRRVRSHCIDLANDHRRFDEAHAVAAVMRDLFKELPTAASELKADVDTLARLSVEKRAEDALAPLFSAVAAAKANVSRVASELKATGFSDSAGVNVAPLHKAFVQTTAAVAGGDHADAPTRVVRSFALDLNNEHDDPAAALALLKGLAAISSPTDPDLAELIATDIRISQNNIDHRLLTTALEAKNHGEALRIIDVMVLRNPTGEEGAQLRLLQDGLKEQRNKRYLKWGGWAAAIAFGLYLVAQEGGGSSYSPSPTYTPDASQPPVEAVAAPPTPEPAAEETPSTEAAVVDATSATDVSQPPVGTDLELEGSQVRYCTIEKARLTALKDMVSDTNSAAIDGFNARVNDYNSRCGSFRYRVADLDAAKAIAERDADRITSEARAIAEGWTQ